LSGFGNKRDVLKNGVAACGTGQSIRYNFPYRNPKNPVQFVPSENKTERSDLQLIADNELMFVETAAVHE
jgi:hypothetical protein